MKSEAAYLGREQWNGLRYLEVLEQIKLRQEMIRMCVGWLYKSIMYDEMECLVTLRDRIKNDPSF